MAAAITSSTKISPHYSHALLLVTITDPFSYRLAMSNLMHSAVTTEKALEKTYEREYPSNDLIFHSDQGVQYASWGFRQKLSEYEMTQSMSAKGNCYDNAVSEIFFKTIKTEHIYKSKYRTREEARQSIFQYIEYFYNRKRRHLFLGNKSPEQFLIEYFIKNRKNVA